MTLGRQLLSLVSTFVLVRILSPYDFGIVAMVGTLTALLGVFADAGLSWAVVQRATVTRSQLDSLFWINTLVGIGLWIVAVAVSPMVASFYHMPELVAVVAVLGTTFLFSGMAVQPIAMLRRQMRMREVAIATLGGNLAGIVVAIGVASAGSGYWALVANTIVSAVVRLALALSFARLLPRFRLRAPGVYSMIRFGGAMLLIDLLIYFARSFDNVLIGREWGADQLGYYSRAYFLMMLPAMLSSGALASVMVSALSALRDDRDRLADAYRKAVFAVAMVSSPLSAGLALVASDATRVVYGPGWAPVAPLLSWLSIAGVIQPLISTYGWLYVALGEIRKYLWWSLLSSTLLIVVFLATVGSGPVPMASSYALITCLFVAPFGLLVVHQVAKIPLLPTIRSVAPVWLSVSLMAVVVIAVGQIASLFALHWVLSLAFQVVLGGVVYIVVLLRISPSSVLGVIPFASNWRWLAGRA